MLDRLKKILEENNGIDCSELTLDSDLKIEIGLSSYQFVEMCAEIEDEFDIEINDDEMMNITTVRDVIDIIQKKLED